MASLARCSACRGFLPSGLASCPNCGTSARAASRLGAWLKAAGGASVAMTLMACYGVPVDPDDPTDTDPTEGTGGATGDSETASGSGSTGGAEPTAGAESSTGGAESSTGAGTDGSSGAGEVEPPPSR